MKHLLIIANWKANKTMSQAEEWFLRLKIDDVGLQNKEVILCPPFSLLSEIKAKIKSMDMPISLGSQDISLFDAGAYTGEMPAVLVKELITYALIGHSERRKYFHETEDMIAKKIEEAASHGITPIICVSNMAELIELKSSIRNHKSVIAYEPENAIGTGNAETPENAEDMARQIQNLIPNTPVLYGGSVTEENVHAFTQQEHIYGVLVGGASLDPHAFQKIIQNA